MTATETIMESHAAADLFPMLSEPEMVALTADMETHGQRLPVVTWRGLVIDGRNRVEACRRIGVQPWTEDRDFDDDADVARFVVSANIHRRHLSESQRGMLAARLETLARGQRSDMQICTSDPVTREEASALVNVSPRTAAHGRRVVERGSTELAAEVDAGNVPVSTASDLAELPKPEQVEVIARGPDEILKAAKRIREEKKAKATEKRRAKQREQAAQATLGAPHIEGVDLRCCDVRAMLDGVTGAGMVHADPPWNYGNQITEHGAVDAHYQDQGMPSIVGAVDAAYDAAGDDCYLLLWCTLPIIKEWFDAAGSLRWTYKSAGVWAKTGRLGVGFHWRGDAEVLMLYVKGNPRPREDATSNLYSGPRGEHSEKPEEWLQTLLATFSDPGALVLDMYAGLAPMARACAATGRRYLGAELDADRHSDAMLRLRG